MMRKRKGDDVMNFLTQLGVLAIIILILVILIKSNRTLSEIYMGGEEEKETIDLSSLFGENHWFRRKERAKYEKQTEEPLEKTEWEEEQRPVGRSGGTMPMTRGRGWYVEELDRWGMTKTRRKMETTPFFIGRSEENDFVLNDLSVSGCHGRVEEKEGSLQLVDQESLNKIWVNGRERQNVVLADHMEVCLGNARIRFVLEEER